MKPPTRAARDGGHEPRDGRLGQQRRRPRDRHPDVRPAPLGRKADRADENAGERAGGHRAAARGAQEHELHEQRLDEVEREVRQRLVPDSADHDRDEAADGDEADCGQQRAAAAEVDARRDEPDARRQHDQDRMQDEPELRHAEVELALEGGQRDEEAAHEQAAAQVVDHDRAAVALGVAADRRGSPPRTGPSRRARPATRRRSASGGSAPRASRPGRRCGARGRRAGSR